MGIRMSAKEYQKYLAEQKTQKTPKHRNRFVYVYEDGFVSGSNSVVNHGGIVRKYDSTKEFQRHKELELLERAGKVQDLRWQVPMLVQDGFTDTLGNKQRAIYYKADFCYVRDGQEVVEDVKGIDKNTGKVQTTEAFRLKWKLLKAKYPEKVFAIY